MTFKSPHVSLVSSAIDVTPTGINEVMILETDLHLNPRHPAYDGGAVQRLIVAAQEYLRSNAPGVTQIRLISNRSGEL